MRVRSSFAAVVALVLVVVVAPEATGKGGTVITSCGQTVTTNAVLGQDLFCNGDGIVVGADRITINLNGHGVFGDGDPGDRGVNAFGCCNNVTVENGVIRDFDVGIDADLDDHFSIKNVVASGNSIGIEAIQGVSDSIQSSTASGNKVGIQIGFAEQSSVTSSTASGNRDYGVSEGGVGNKIKSVTAAGNGIGGLLVGGSGTSVTSSTANGNGFDGIDVPGDSVTLKGNTTDGNGFGFARSDPPFDFHGLGISATGPNPSGKNTAHGNDDDAECNPSYLC